MNGFVLNFELQFVSPGGFPFSAGTTYRGPDLHCRALAPIQALLLFHHSLSTGLAVGLGHSASDTEVQGHGRSSPQCPIAAVLPARSSSIFARTGGTLDARNVDGAGEPAGKQLVETIMFCIMHAWETLYIVYIYIYTYIHICV